MPEPPAARLGLKPYRSVWVADGSGRRIRRGLARLLEDRRLAVNQARRDGVHQIMDHLVIGAGPADLQFGYFLQHAGRDYVILEAGSTGTFFRIFPRHRSLISINKPHTGESTPNAICEWTGTRCSPTIPDCCSPDTASGTSLRPTSKRASTVCLS